MRQPNGSIHLILGVALAWTTGCGKPAADPTANDEKQQSIVVTEVSHENLTDEIELSATIEGYESAQLMSKIDGYVADVNIDIGDMVRKGDVLATLDVPELQDKVDRRARLVDQAIADVGARRAEVALADAHVEEQMALVDLREIELRRTKGLVAKGAFEQEKLDEARFALRAIQAALNSTKAEIEAAQSAVVAAQARKGVAEAELKEARSMARYSKISAPFDGLITARRIDPGAFVRPATSSAATALFEIARVDRVRVVVYLPMDQAGKLDDCDHVVLDHIEALPGVRVESLRNEPLKISRYARSFDAGSRMMRAEIDIDNIVFEQETGKQLKPGDYARVLLTLAIYDDKPTVPVSALGKHADGKRYVILVDKSNTCVHVPVQVLIEKGKIAVLDDTAGRVKINDRVVAKELNRIKNQTTLQAGQIKFVEASKLY